MSTIHQIPSPPSVSSFPTAVPVCPKQNRSKPTQKNGFNAVLKRQDKNETKKDNNTKP
jgi:hypothetical protein